MVTAKKPDKRHKPFTRVCNCPFSNLINHRLSFRQVGVAVVWCGVVWVGLVWVGLVWLCLVVVCIALCCSGCLHWEMVECHTLARMSLQCTAATPRHTTAPRQHSVATTGQSHLNSLDLLSLPARTTLLPTTSLL